MANGFDNVDVPRKTHATESVEDLEDRYSVTKLQDRIFSATSDAVRELGRLEERIDVVLEPREEFEGKSAEDSPSGRRYAPMVEDLLRQAEYAEALTGKIFDLAQRVRLT